MDVSVSTISDLLTAIGGIHGEAAATCAGAEPPTHVPTSLILADSGGNVLLQTDLGREEAPSTAEALASRLSTTLAGDDSCLFEMPTESGPCMAAGVRLPGGGEPAFLGCLLAAPDGSAPPREAMDAGRAVRDALAWVINWHERQLAELRTRIRHLLDEQHTLKISHSEALNAAVDERETRLREQQEHMARLQAIMMTAADGIITIDERGIIESFNEAAASIFGYSSGEVIGRNVTILMPLSFRQSHNDQFHHYLESGDSRVMGQRRELLGQRKDGSTFPMDLAVSEVQIGRRRIFTGILRDITERKAAEQELKRLHMQNEMILNSAGEGIVGVDCEGNVMFANPAAARILGWQPEELIGRPQHDTIHHSKASGEPLAHSDCPVCSTLGNPKPSPSGDQVFWRKDGTCFPAEYVSTPIREGDQLAGAVVTFRDTSQRRMLEAQLRQAQKLESIGQLAAGIAHEINTPTQYIGDNTRFMEDAFAGLSKLLDGYGRLLQAAREGQVPSELVGEIQSLAEQSDVDYLITEIPNAIQQSLEGVERVTRIVRSMKEFSHPGGEQKQTIDLNQAIQSTVTVSRNEWKYTADLITDLDPELPMVVCLPGEINQVILNLIVNAAHAIQDVVRDEPGKKGTITVSTRQQDDCVEIRVADTGTGIPEKIRSKLFDPFFTTKEVGKGTGQGLAIAHSVVTEKHGGTISFETEVGQGTTFIVRLPLGQDSSCSGVSESEEADPLC